MLMALSGPSRPPLAGGKPRHLVILLHGLGADGNDLIGLQQYWGRLVPDAEFISPNAPFPCDMAPYGYQWFSVQDRTPAAALPAVAPPPRCSTPSSTRKGKSAESTKATPPSAAFRKAR